MRRRSEGYPPYPGWTIAELGNFFASHRRSFVDQATRRVGDRNVAEELVQDALIKVILAAPELNSESHALAYLRRTINNLAIDRLRLEGRKPHLISVDESDFELERSFASESDLEGIISAAEDAAILREALSLLSPAERSALVMWEIEGRSAREIAQELRIKESSVRHTLFRARASLRKILEEFVIDEARGLTALDLLSNSYSRVARTTKKSSKAVLSLLLIVFAISGFNNLSFLDLGQDLPSTSIESSPLLPVKGIESIEDNNEAVQAPRVGQSNENGKSQSSKGKLKAEDFICLDSIRKAFQPHLLLRIQVEELDHFMSQKDKFQPQNQNLLWGKYSRQRRVRQTSS